MHVKYQVNVVKNPENLATEPSGYITEERTPVTIYRRILRPARITFNGDRAVTDNVQGTSDAVEMESWTLNKSLNNNMNNMNKRWIFGSTRSFSLIYLILIKFSETFRFLCTLWSEHKIVSTTSTSFFYLHFIWFSDRFFQRRFLCNFLFFRENI